MEKVEKLLQDILDKLEEIRQNTAPVIPTVWVYPSQDNTDDSWRWDGGCQAEKTTAGRAGCNCPNCKPRTGGCASCGCMNIAIYTEDGNWWCYDCHKKVR